MNPLKKVLSTDDDELIHRKIKPNKYIEKNIELRGRNVLIIKLKVKFCWYCYVQDVITHFM